MIRWVLFNFHLTVSIALLILQSFPSLHLRHSSFSNPSLTLPKSQLILQPSRCFTYATVHSATLLSLLLRHRIFTYVTWRAAHAIASYYRLALWSSLLMWKDGGDIISVSCPRAGPSLQEQEPSLQFCRRQVFHHKLRNQDCSFTRDWICAVASVAFRTPLSLSL